MSKYDLTIEYSASTAVNNAINYTALTIVHRRAFATINGIYANVFYGCMRSFDYHYSFLG